ncbi:MAG: hypothetical protein NZ455_05990 [Bacteroidia bacterium]|nr:hypothetical protein [Bacteroidia bacterium]
MSLAALGSACYGLTVLRPTRPPPWARVKEWARASHRANARPPHASRSSY